RTFQLGDHSGDAIVHRVAVTGVISGVPGRAGHLAKLGGIPGAESGGIVNRRRHRFLLHRLLIGVGDQGFVAEFLPFLPLIHPFSSFLEWASPPAHPWLIFTGCPVWYGDHRDLSRGSSHPKTGRVLSE